MSGRNYGQYDWAWMIRTAAEPLPPEHEADPYDEFSDIWQGHQGRGHDNAAAQDWLDQQVNYRRVPGSSSPHAWVGEPGEDYQYRTTEGEPQWNETNREIDDSHQAFENAYNRGLNTDVGMPSRFNPGGQYEPEPWEPTGDERLRSDEGWLLGPGKSFDWPGGRDQYAAIHNGMHARGFELDNEAPAGAEQGSPVYVHSQTRARIRPGVDEEGNPTWDLTGGPGGGTSQHSNPASAAAVHQQAVDAQAAAEAERFRQQAERYRREDEARERRHRRDYDDYQPSRTPRAPSRRETPDYIPKTKAQQMHWRDLFDQAINGNDGHGRAFERASVRSEHNPYRGNTGRLYGVHEDQWNQDFDNDARGTGKVSQAIYHYATPIAWKYHEVQPDGTYDEGNWRIPATSFGSGGFFSTGRVQGLMSGALHRAPDHTYLHDPLISHRMHKVYLDAGLRRSGDRGESYHAVDALGNHHHITPSRSGQTVEHAVWDQNGRTFRKRVTPLEAGQNFYDMQQPEGYGGPTDTVAYLRAKKYRDSGHTPRRRDPDQPPLRAQPRLPGIDRQMRQMRESSVDVLGWSEFLRG